MSWTVNIATFDLATRADVTQHVQKFNGSVRHHAPGEWTCELALPVWAPLVAAWPDFSAGQPPLRIALRENNEVLISGEIRTAQLIREGATTSVQLTGGDEFAEITGRIIYPQPDDTAPWTVDTHHVVTGQASFAVAEYIRRHAGMFARTERIIPGLNVSDNGAGRVGTWWFRLIDLAEAVARISEEENLTIDLQRRLDGGIDVSIGSALQRPGLVLDESALGDYTVTLAAPSASTVVAAGTGEGTARLFSIKGDEATGASRRESFTDQRNIASTDSLARTAETHRLASAATTAFAGELAADAATRYRWRQHYGLGDTISLRVAGTTWPVQVVGVSITIDLAGLHTAPVLGSTPRNEITKLFRDVASLTDRIANLEIA